MTISPLIIDSELMSLLQRCELPTADLNAESAMQFFGWRAHNQLVGCVALQCYNDVALLRSLAVLPEHRNGKLGSALLQYAEQEARAQHVKRLYLLTTTAASYFAKQGFVMANRGQAPQSIKLTSQFSGLCPSSATFMDKDISRN